MFLLLNLALAAEADIVRIEGPTFFVALGHDDHVRSGDTVTVVRRVQVTDPVTGRTLSDRFTVGEAEIVEVGASLTLVRASPSTVAALRLGDVVIAPEHEPEPEPLVFVEVEAEPGAVTTVSADRRGFEEAFRRSAATQDLEERERLWRAFVAQFPESSLVPVVQAELRAIEALKTSAPALVEPVPAEDFVLKLQATGAATVEEGSPFEVVVTVPQLNRVTASRLYFRRLGEQTWREAPLDQAGDTALRGQVPEEAVRPPGVEWYVSVEDYEHGEFRAGNPSQPRLTEVTGVAEAPAVVDRSTVSLRYEFVDFYYLTGADRWQQAEGDFVYRIDRRQLYSVGVGGGYYQGVSAPPSIIDTLDREDLADAVTAVGYKYAYGQLELRLLPLVAIQGRAVMGVQLDGFSVGGEGRLRLGREDSSNLLLGGGFVPGIGQEFELALDFDAVPRVPMLAGVYVTNQPGLDLSDLGVRLVYEARYALNEQVELGGRVGYQLRNINHSGPAFGLTAVFSW